MIRSGNLFAMEGEKWRFLRNKLSPTFTSGKMKMMFETVSDKGNDFVTAIKKANPVGPVEMRAMCVRLTSDIIGSCAFGIECGALVNGTSDIIKISKLFTDSAKSRLLRALFLMNFPNLSKKLSLRHTPKEAEDYFMKILRETVDYRESNNVQRNDFLNLLIQLKNKGYVEDDEVGTGGDTRKLTFNQIAAQAFIFFL
jgi:cytochrome P450 family 6